VGIAYGQEVRALGFSAFAHHLDVSFVYRKEVHTIDPTDTTKWHETELMFRELTATAKVKEVTLALPEEFFYTTIVRLPHAPEKDIRPLIELHLENHIPNVKAQFTTECTVLARHADSMIVRALVRRTALHAEYSRYLTAHKTIGVTLESSLSALARAVMHKDDARQVMLVNIGAHMTEIAIVAYGVTVFTTTVGYGGKEVISHIHEVTQISEHEIGQLLSSQGVSTRGPHKTFHKALLLALSPIVDATKSMLLHWGAHTKEVELHPECNTLFVAGTHAYIQGLPEFLSRALGVEGSWANVWQGAHLAQGAVPPLPLREALGFGVAIGAALKYVVKD
jgi:Tfp pilus assembly PilM family ATPase